MTLLHVMPLNEKGCREDKNSSLLYEVQIKFKCLEKKKLNLNV
jgi:hypothetical protein